MQDKAIIDALHALSERGVLDPVAVVEAARDKTSPLHDRFTWDDTEAAQAWRVHEARNLIRVCVEYLPGRTDLSPVFVSLHDDRKTGDGYRQFVHVMSHDERRSALLSQALSELETFKRKYAMLRELAEVFKAASTAITKSKKMGQERRGPARR